LANSFGFHFDVSAFLKVATAGFVAVAASAALARTRAPATPAQTMLFHTDT
jgi:hypothetical protein